MKGNKMKFFSLYCPRIERKGNLTELYLKLFNKKEYYKYMRALARQRIEEKLFFKQLSKSVGYEKYCKTKNFKEKIETIMKGL